VRTFLFIAAVVIGLPAAAIGAWYVLDNTTPGAVGTPAHAGAVSNGEPEDCVTVQLTVGARENASTKVLLKEDDVLRGTFEANGGFGNVDIMMRIVSPQGGEVHVSPRERNYDFVLAPRFAGEYTFVFDNRYSMVTAKAIGLYYCIPGAGESRTQPSH
jgi:hypothetical protein